MRFIQQLILIAMLCCSCLASAQQSVNAQMQKAFYRLTIVNEQGELLLVKIKKPQVWVTTGLYQVPDEFSFEQFHIMAATYGLEIKDIKLHGAFEVSPAQDKPFQTRYFYQATASNDVSKMPEFIEQTQWLAPDEALKILSFPHISFLTRQTLNHPQQVWSAKIQRYSENSQHKIKVFEGFHIKSEDLPERSINH